MFLRYLARRAGDLTTNNTDNKSVTTFYGNDSVTGSVFQAAISTGAGNDAISGGNGIDSINGGDELQHKRHGLPNQRFQLCQEINFIADEKIASPNFGGALIFYVKKLFAFDVGGAMRTLSRVVSHNFTAEGALARVGSRRRRSRHKTIDLLNQNENRHRNN